MNVSSAYILSILLCITFRSYTQSTTNDSLRLEIRPYGSFRGHIAVYNSELELQQNASRVGFELSVSKRNLRYFAGSELSLNMFKADVVFNVDASVQGGFVDVESDQVNQIFGTRLGYLGVEFDRAGTITIGKQWSVYYDVTSYTDKFNVFGGQASATYVANTDGGTTGTGRADQSITYRNQFGPLTVGAQLQIRTAFNNSILDGYGLSGQLKVVEGLKVGAAYNRTIFNDTLRANAIGLNDNPEYWTLGLSYVKNRWNIGVVFANQSNGDLRRIPIEDELLAVIFEAQGVEAYAKYAFNQISVIGGYNRYSPKVTDLPLNERFQTEYFVIGLEYHPVQQAYFYSEFRFHTENNRDHLGLSDPDVFTLGLRIDLEQTFSKNIK